MLPSFLSDFLTLLASFSLLHMPMLLLYCSVLVFIFHYFFFFLPFFLISLRARRLSHFGCDAEKGTTTIKKKNWLTDWLANETKTNQQQAKELNCVCTKTATKRQIVYIWIKWIITKTVFVRYHRISLSHFLYSSFVRSVW